MAKKDFFRGHIIPMVVGVLVGLLTAVVSEGMGYPHSIGGALVATAAVTRYLTPKVSR